MPTLFKCLHLTGETVNLVLVTNNVHLQQIQSLLQFLNSGQILCVCGGGAVCVCVCGGGVVCVCVWGGAVCVCVCVGGEGVCVCGVACGVGSVCVWGTYPTHTHYLPPPTHTIVCVCGGWGGGKLDTTERLTH